VILIDKSTMRGFNRLRAGPFEIEIDFFENQNS